MRLAGIGPVGTFNLLEYVSIIFRNSSRHSFIENQFYLIFIHIQRNIFRIPSTPQKLYEIPSKSDFRFAR